MDKFTIRPTPKPPPGVLIHDAIVSKEDFDYENFMKQFEYKQEYAYPEATVKEKKSFLFDAIKLKYITIGEEEAPKAKRVILSCVNKPLPASPTEYYLNNRKYFVKFIRTMLKGYTPNSATTCDDLMDDKNISALPHQLLVQRYINADTPYRGLLLYHGLGSGKTCSSILITEGLKAFKDIVVMTPASLETNFLQELKKCGDVMYKVQQRWEWEASPTEEELIDRCLTRADLVSRNKRRGLWRSMEGEPNYSEMPEADQISINKQIDKMIRNKYNLIHYNGIDSGNFSKKITPGGINIFSNKVVVIDEAHNFVSRIVNKLKKKDHPSYLMYDLLMKAENCKIILLTGTPIINYTYEIGILFNIVRGYIDAWDCVLAGISEEEIKRNLVDADCIIKKQNRIIVTQTPHGFVRNDNNAVRYTQMDSSTFESRLTEFVKQRGGTVSKQKYTALPTDPEEFRSLFVKDDKLVNTRLLSSRITGLVSYFPDLTGLMPTLKPPVVHEITMSKQQYDEYKLVRAVERERDKKPKGNTDEDVASTYRIATRMLCNTTYPTDVRSLRPGKMIEKEVELEEAEEVTSEELSTLTSFYKALDASDYTRNIEEYSPKYKEMLTTIMSRTGLQLLYSQFLTIEGIMLFTKVLDAKGYAEFKLKRVGGEWVVNIPEEAYTKPLYVTYIGTKTAEEKELIRNIFNKKWEGVPEKLKVVVEKMLFNLFIITAAGAEGISLKNVQYVHIMEPYWNQVRLDQVIGRARRICSHNTLSKVNQYVEVHMYIMKFPELDISKPNFPEILKKDVEDGFPRTTDEYMYRLAKRKTGINTSLLDCIRDASIDCFLYNNCAGLDTDDTEVLMYHPNIMDDETEEHRELNETKVLRSFLKYKGEPFAYYPLPEKVENDKIKLFLAGTNKHVGFLDKAKKNLFTLDGTSKKLDAFVEYARAL
jgi:hypothetical protein